MENQEKQPNFMAQVATIVTFFTAIIQLIVILITINFYNSQQKYAERQYLMLEKIIEKQQEISAGQEQLLIKEEQQLIRIDNMVRIFNQPAQ
jgi:predicted PurR-regulated permease PerM